ncbi:F0F1 ATP synthase subunit B family protein [Xylophilus sp.]|uniref:F0F1 ATP synthase subunit B family protein n=1 Tax=Xylophilus sp. TaxID=2653893 RepID=UPI0013B9AAEF|nr:hypothetical protein [Xylophilus sp.]KAF1045289.1 MAG: ATP synthase subunit b, sodium ion specific [Xylophilus sp.]
MKFDWATFAFQLVNVVVLLALLRHFLFRPVADVIARRQAETDAVLKAAETARAEATAAAARALAEAKATAAARRGLMQQTQAEAEAQRRAVLDQAHAEAARILADGKALLERQAGEAAAKLLEQARDLALVVAARALSAQPPGIAGYAQRLADALSALTASEREAILAGSALTLVSAAPLSPDDLAAAQRALAPFGIAPGVERDPALIAGLELRSAAGVVRNSLAHDLDRIAAAMREAQPQGGPA